MYVLKQYVSMAAFEQSPRYPTSQSIRQMKLELEKTKIKAAPAAKCSHFLETGLTLSSAVML